MGKVIGVGGVFFKSADQKRLNEWYQRVLGLDVESWGGVVFTPEMAVNHPGAATVFSSFASNTDYFQPSSHDYMVNLMVDDLEAVLSRCREHGVEPVKAFEDQPNGRFAHIIDPDGRKLELWEPRPM